MQVSTDLCRSRRCERSFTAIAYPSLVAAFRFAAVTKLTLPPLITPVVEGHSANTTLPLVTEFCTTLHSFTALQFPSGSNDVCHDGWIVSLNLIKEPRHYVIDAEVFVRYYGGAMAHP